MLKNNSCKTLHLGWSHICVGFFAYVTLCCSLILPTAPDWLVTILEISVYVGFSYSSMTWIVANVVAYGFIMHFDDMSLVTDTQMKLFCFGTCIISTIIQIALDRFYPLYNTATYYLFEEKKYLDR